MPASESAQSSDALFSAVHDRLKAMAGQPLLAAGGRSATLDMTALKTDLG